LTTDRGGQVRKRSVYNYQDAVGQGRKEEKHGNYDRLEKKRWARMRIENTRVKKGLRGITKTLNMEGVPFVKLQRKRGGGEGEKRIP